MKIWLNLLAFVVFFALAEATVHYMKLHRDGTNVCTILSQENLRKFKGLRNTEENAIVVKVKDAVVPPPGDGPPKKVQDQSKIIEIYAHKITVLEAHSEKLCKSIKTLAPLVHTPKQIVPEIIKIVDGGDQGNRIDVVFMGDGYTATERDEFFEDIERLTDDMFKGATFRSYLPLFNIWGIYVASVESGIGYDGPLNTPFRLYRESGQLRGIYPGNSTYARQVCGLTGIGGCDYPSLIGNDDFYGGLGGEFVISTRSNTTGTIVLRHEMGHNMADVGEEYDGGSVYSGVNAARTVNNLGWTPWLSGEAKEERVMYRLLAYLWEDLNESDIKLDFTSDGTYSRWYMTISVTAAGEEDCLEFLLDGEPLPWTSSGTDDRQFYDWYGDQGFTQGAHTLTIRSKTNSTNAKIPRMVASVDLHEFGNDAEFNIDNDYISAYPTWSYINTKTFRPSNAGCLMRNMTHNKFCSVCQEGIWSQFLQRISIIDQVIVSPDGAVTLETLKLGHLRAPDNEVDGEMLEVRWTMGGVEQPLLNDQFEIMASPGQWTVTVMFVTPEVRADPQNLLTETEAFVVPGV